MSLVKTLTPAQRTVVSTPFDQGVALFVHGPAGGGKTTALQRRLISLLAAGVSSYTVLTLLPEPAAADAYQAALADAGLGPYVDLQLATFTGLAREMVALFWPLVARPAGFAAPHKPPTFLSYDLAQVLMRQTIDPLQQAGFFEGLRLRPQQILSQLLDNLNRAALNRLSLDEMERRLVQTWSGDPDHVRFFQQAAEAARLFRQRCLDSGLLDLSLVVDLFQHHLLDHPVFRRYFTERYQHLLVDNLEEMPPAGVQFLRSLLPGRDSAVLVFDEQGGYRRYLAADPQEAWTLSAQCQVHTMPESLVAGGAVAALANLIQRQLVGPADLTYAGAAEAVAGVIKPRYRRDMVRQVAARIAGLRPASVAVIAPYLDGALRYALTNELQAAGVPVRLLRRRGSPRDEPLVRAWLTLAALAHPHWGVVPSEYDVAEGLALAVGWLDRPRAVLAASRLYEPAGPELRPVAALSESEVGRVGPAAVVQLDELRCWLAVWRGTEPLDRFFAHLFGDLLSSSRFHPQPDLRGAAVCDWLVRAAGQFRRAAPALGLAELSEQGRAFFDSIFEGLVSGDPLPEPELGGEDAVIIATLYAYVLNGPAVDYQVWLEAGATGWWEIPRQPLSNAFVLSPGWVPTRLWTEADSFGLRNQLLARLMRGLCARCGRGVLLATSDLDRRGQRQDGPLWRVLEPLLSGEQVGAIAPTRFR